MVHATTGCSKPFAIFVLLVTIFMHGCRSQKSREDDRTYLVVITQYQLNVDEDGSFEALGFGGKNYDEPTEVHVNGVPVIRLDGGGTVVPISDCLRKGKNEVTVSNISQNRLFIYVADAPKNWMTEGKSFRLGEIDGSSGESEDNSIEFQVDKNWTGPRFEALNEEEKSPESVRMVISELVDLASAREGALFFNQIARGQDVTAKREGFEGMFAEAKKDFTDHINKAEKKCKLNEYHISNAKNGLLISGDPAIEIDELWIQSLSIVKLNGELVIWRVFSALEKDEGQ